MARVYMYTDNLTLLYNCPVLRLVDNTWYPYLRFDNIVRVLRRSLKKRKSERDVAMFRKSWSWNVKEARGLRRRRMTMPREKLD